MLHSSEIEPSTLRHTCTSQKAVKGAVNRRPPLNLRISKEYVVERFMMSFQP
jgi:hypothetical protein